MTTSDDFEWSPPDANGLQRCSRHPDAAPFRAATSHGCDGCAADPIDVPPPPGPHEIDAQRGIIEVAAHDAEDRGLPDMLELEQRADAATRECRRELRVCRRIAAELEQRARDLRDRRVESAEPERDSLRAFAEAVKYRGLAAKALDTLTKSTKLALPAAIERHRATRLLETARLIDRRGRH